MSDLNPYPALFSPIELAGQRLKNRILHASVSLRLGAHQGMHAAYWQYFVNRARGGAGMVITDPLGIAPHQGLERVTAWNDSMFADLQRLADGVRAYDCALLAQIQDTGRGRHVTGRVHGTLSASALPDDLSYSMPEPMSLAQIRAFIDQIGDSAARLQRAGFSGVEISAGHGHLFHQFLSPASNQRDDDYGADLAGRCRLLVEAARIIRDRCGPGFILGVKLPGDDGVPGGIDPDLAAQVAAHLVSQVKVDLLAYAQGSHHRSLEMHLPDDSYPRLPWMPLIRRLRAATPGVPVMGLGRITDPAEGEGILTRGDADLVGLCRPLIADPAWPAKAQAGRARDIRYCVSCNTCWKTINQNKSIACDNNPRLATREEVDPAPARASGAKRLVVVGAGIAGLEAAHTAASRGHQVTLFGASNEPGGQARQLSRLPLAESLSSVHDYQFAQVQRLGVDLRLGQRASPQDILACQPDAVVLATGAQMIWPQALPAHLRQEGWVGDLREAIVPLLATRGRQRGTAVVYDMDATEGTYAAVEYLRDRFDHVVLLADREGLAEDAVLMIRQRVWRRFFERGIEVHTLATPVWTEDMEREGRLGWRSVFGGPVRFIEDVAFFTFATPRRPRLDLLAPLQAAGVAVHRIGDCLSARDTLAATAEGYRIGCME